jgi:TfoX/Sxy family transcriptional regulator of competence genes
VGIRLPKPEREQFLQQFNTTLYEAHGAVMKEYVTVPEALLADTEALKPYLEVSYAYVKTLKPKPTKKPKP